jgi:hypothetical protein
VIGGLSSRRSGSVLIGALLALVAAACHGEAPGPRTPIVIWRKLGSWSGQGPTQTDAFTSDTGSLRLRWETRNETTPGKGMLRVTLHSDVSGRPLLVAVDVRGVGRDIAYVSEDPRPFFLAVESANLDWTIEAEEAVAATKGTDFARGDR